MNETEKGITAENIDAEPEAGSENTEKRSELDDLREELGRLKAEYAERLDRLERPDENNDPVKEYLKGVIGRRQKAIVMDGAGTGVKALSPRPMTVRDAGELAKGLIEKK